MSDFASVVLTLQSGRFIDYLLERPDVKPLWKSYTQHVFVKRLAKGTLSETSFKKYLVQDYLYLVCHHSSTHHPLSIKRFTRATDPLCQSLRVGRVQEHVDRDHRRRKSPHPIAFLSFSPIATLTLQNSQSAQMILQTKRETALHLTYCAKFGLSKTDVEAEKESQGQPLTAFSPLTPWRVPHRH
jgi:hypothetical protein